MAKQEQEKRLGGGVQERHAQNVPWALVSKHMQAEPSWRRSVCMMCSTALVLGWPSEYRCIAWRISWDTMRWTLEEPGRASTKRPRPWPGHEHWIARKEVNR